MKGSQAVVWAALLTPIICADSGNMVLELSGEPQLTAWYAQDLSETTSAVTAQILDKTKCSAGHPLKCIVGSSEVLQKSRVVEWPQRAPNFPKSQEYKVSDLG